MTDRPVRATPRSSRIGAGLLVVVVLLLGSGCTLGIQESAGRPAGAINIDTVPLIAPDDREGAPPLEGRTTQDEPFDSDAVRGRPVLVNFWASWCGPCATEIPQLVALRERYGPDVAFVGVNVRDTMTNARSFERDHGVTYPSIFDPDVSLAAAFGGIAPQALPSTILIDRQGMIAVRIFGAVSQGQLEPYLDRLTAE